MTTFTERDWTPVKRGDVYCSPACGGNCKRSAYDAAVKRTKDAIASMTHPEAWKSRISENMGWFASIQCGGMTIICAPDGTFWALLSSDDESVGSGEVYWSPERTTRHKTATAAALQCLKTAEQFTEKCLRMVRFMQTRLT